MNNTTDLEMDGLKTAWRRLEQRLTRRNQLDLEFLRERKLRNARHSLQPLHWGQLAQVILGTVSIVFGIKIWSNYAQSTPVFISGLIAHAYGVALIVAAAQVLHRIRSVDYAAPVVEIQKQLLKLERTYVNTGWLVGLPWWLLWIPFSLGIAGMAGIDLLQRAQGSGWITWSLVVGTLGMVATVAWYVWATNPRRGERATQARAAMAGRSLRQARLSLAEIERFENG